MKNLLLALVAACTGPVGVQPSMSLVDMTSANIEEECDYLVETYPHKRLTCGTKSEVFGYGSTASCVKDLTDANQLHPSCTATTAELEACMEYLYGMTCDNAGVDVPESCKRVFSSECD